MNSNNKELIIVAGAGKGIGYAITNKLQAEYSNYFLLVISRDVKNLDLIKNPNLFILKADLSNLTSENKSFIIDKLNQFSLRGIIFTAGVLEIKNIGQITKPFFHEIYNNNLWSFIDLIQTVNLFINDSTHIVTIGSMGGFTGTMKFKGMSTYSSSKAALSSFTECLAEELKLKGASANCLMIGAVETEMMKKAFPEFETKIKANDMASFIIRFFLEDKKLFNGKVIPVSSTIP